MSFPLARILYILSCVALTILLWPNPITIFLAACFSSLSTPVYRRLRYLATSWRVRRDKSRPLTFRDKLRQSFSRAMPISVYTAFILGCLLLPLAVLILLVAPQAATGIAYLRDLKAKNFQMPEEWTRHYDDLLLWLNTHLPSLGEALNETRDNIDAMLNDVSSLLINSDLAGTIINRSIGVVGSTMSAMWLIFLFIVLTILFTTHGRLIRKISYRVLNVPLAMVNRFLLAIHRALKAILLGIVFVALVQGALCGIGFAVAGVRQPAFWGMLATMVAPIPVVGTALVWLPLCISLWFTGQGMAAICLALWGALFVAGVDNVLRPFFLRQGIKAPFFVLILSILCGLGTLGAVGLIAGPVLLAIGMQAYDEANRYYRRAL